jgi:hypothetical protein
MGRPIVDAREGRRDDFVDPYLKHAKSDAAVLILKPYRADSKLQDHQRTQLDRLYQKITDDLDELLLCVGLKRLPEQRE